MQARTVRRLRADHHQNSQLVANLDLGASWNWFDVAWKTERLSIVIPGCPVRFTNATLINHVLCDTLRVLKIRPANIGAAKVGTGQIRVAKVRTVQFAALEIRPS